MARILGLLIGLFLLVVPIVPATGTMTPLDESKLLYRTKTRGETREAAADAARLEAVKSAAGRLLNEGHLLLADSLLDRYLENYFSRFVTATEVTKADFVGGQNVLDVNVFVDYTRLSADLAEKKFLWQPQARPTVVVYLAEERDGTVATEGVAREALNVAFTGTGARVFDKLVTAPPLSTDLSTDDLLLKAGIVTAQRNGIEMIVTGTAKTVLREERDIYYDKYLFYDCEVKVQMVRVDTGEVLHTATATGTASAINRGEAIQTAIQRAATAIATELTGKINDYWPFVVQGKTATHELLLTGVDEGRLKIVLQNLEALAPNTKVALRKRYNSSASIVIQSEATRQDLLNALAALPYPSLQTVNPKAENRFEVQVGG